ncbi:putative domain XH, partial [Sesbania bispinosa]
RRPQIWAFKVLGICLKMTDHSNEGAVTVNKESKASVNLQMENEEQKEQLLAKIMELEKQLDKKHKLELDMEQSLKEYGDLVQMLIIKEHRSNEELLEIRKELINGIKELSTHADIGVKRVGELDTRPFLEAMMLRYKDEEAGEKAAELCSLWQGYLSNPGWHPFRIVTVEGKSMEVIYEDEKLKGLKNDIGEGAYKAVVEALKEMNEYNPIARCVIPELWNYKQGRSATSLEGVRFLLKQWRNERAANFMVV